MNLTAGGSSFAGVYEGFDALLEVIPWVMRDTMLQYVLMLGLSIALGLLVWRIVSNAGK